MSDQKTAIVMQENNKVNDGGDAGIQPTSDRKTKCQLCH